MKAINFTKKTGFRTLAFLLVLLTLLSFMPGGLFAPATAQALPAADNAIENILPSQFPGGGGGAPVKIPLEDLSWTKSLDHPGYDTRAYTEDASAKYNGYSTPNHVVADGDAVRFLGYDIAPYMDLLYTNDYPGGFDKLSLVMRPVVMNFHTFSESGLLFNGSFTGSYYTGYALILKCGNMEGMGDGGEASLSLVYIDNEYMTGSSYSPGTMAGTRTLLGTYKTGIQNLSTPVFGIDIENRAGGGFSLYLDGIMVADIAAPGAGGNGFGFFTAYYAHNCEILTVLEYSQVEVTINSAPNPTFATVEFLDIVTGAPIAEQQVISGYAYDTFKVTPPTAITAASGAVYSYVEASRKSLNPIIFNRNPSKNEIVLYYDVPIGATKNASVRYITGNGTPASPVSVEIGDIIDYSIELNNPGGARAVPSSPAYEALDIADIWYGASSGFARTAGEDIYVWGANGYGQLGLGDAVNRIAPTLNPFFSRSDPACILPAGVTVTAVARSGSNTIVLTSNGNVYLLGIRHTTGQVDYLTTPTLEPSLSRTSATCVLPSGVTVVDVQCGDEFAVARASDGVLYVWGKTNDGRLGLGGSGSSTIVTPTQLSVGAAIAGMRVGESEVIAWTAAGDFYVWGYNGNGQLGLGDVSNRSTPTLNASLSRSNILCVAPAGATLVDVRLAGGSALAWFSNGDVYVWGNNASGQLGLGSSGGAVTIPTLNTLLSRKETSCLLPSGAAIADIKYGNGFMIALASSGDVYVCGDNADGRLGLGDALGRAALVRNAALSATGVTGIWAGESSAMAQATNGIVYAWGYNAAGQLGLGSTASPVSSPAPVPKLSSSALMITVTNVWSGADHSIARASDGGIYVWGQNTYGQLGLSGDNTSRNVPTLNAALSALNIEDIWCRGDFTIARTAAGDFYVWGANGNGQLGLAGNTTNMSTPTINSTLKTLGIRDIWCGPDYTIAKAADGKIYVWGANNNGQLGLTGDTARKDTPTLNAQLTAYGITDVWCGGNFVIAKASGGDFYVWGYNRYGHLGLGGSTPDYPYAVTTPTLNPTLRVLGISEIWCGANSSFARTPGGDFYVWGYSPYYQLGLDGTVGIDTPTLNPYLSPSGGADYIGSPVTDLWCGDYHVIAQAANGNVYVWGYNNFGQLGMTGSNATVPTPNPALTALGITDLTGYGSSVIARANNGGVYVWGQNSGGQLGLSDLSGKSTPNLTPFVYWQKNFQVRDLIPAGLRLVNNSWGVTNGSGAPQNVGTLKVTTGQASGRDRLVFDFTLLPTGKTVFHFKAAVESSGYFVNTGEFFESVRGVTYETNPTYHATPDSGVYAVEEKYQPYNGGAGGGALKDETYRYFGLPGSTETNYSPYASVFQPIVDGNGDTWRYYAYKRIGVEGAPVAGMPPMGTGGNWCWANVDANHEIIFYFVKDADLIISYEDIDDKGVPLKSDYTAKISGADPYYMPASHMNSFMSGPDAWNYVNKFALDGGGEQSGAPNSPVYTPVISGTKHITLYFTKSPVVTVQYREYRENVTDRQNARLLYNLVSGINKEQFIVNNGVSFNPMAQPAVASSVANGVKNTLSRPYPTYRGWSDDGGVTFHEGNPPAFTVSGSRDIILYFSTTYIITEKYHGLPDNVELLPDVTTTISGDGTFVGAPPATIDDGDYTWEYRGYKIGDDNAPLQIGTPSVGYIAEDLIIIYVYEKGAASTNVTVIERWREYGNTNHKLANDATVTIPKGSPYTDNAKDIPGWEIVGWYLDGETGTPRSMDNPPSGELTSVNGPHTVTYVYKRAVKLIDKAAKAGSRAYANGEIEYTLTVTLPDDLTAYDTAKITDVFPNSLTYKTGSAKLSVNGGAATAVTPVITPGTPTSTASYELTNAQFTPGAVLNLTLTFTVNKANWDGKTIHNDAQLYLKPKGNPYNPTPDGGDGEDVPPLIEKNAKAGSRAVANRDIEYTITVILPDDLTAYDTAKIVDVFPNSLVYKTGSAKLSVNGGAATAVTPVIVPGTPASTASYELTSAQFTPGAVLDLTLTFTVNPAAWDGRTIHNDAQLFLKPKGNPYNPAPDGGDDENVPPLIEKTAKNGSAAYADGDIEYTIKVMLPDDLTAYATANIVDLYPASLTYKPGSATLKINGGAATPVTPVITAGTPVSKASYELTSAQFTPGAAVELTLVFTVNESWDGKAVHNDAELYLKPAGNPYNPTPDGGDDENVPPRATPPFPPGDPDATSISLAAKKITRGKILAAGQFTFGVFEGETQVASGTNDGRGDIVFSAIEYKAAGNHVYTIRETSASGNGWTTDDSRHTVTVTVTQNGDVLSASAVYAAGEVPTFVNMYRAGKVTLKISKALVDSNGNTTGNGTEFTVRLTDAAGKTIGQYVLKANGDEVTISDLENDARYTITELTATGYRAVGFTVSRGGFTVGGASGAAITLGVPPLYRDTTITVVLTNTPGTWVPPGEPPLTTIPEDNPPLNEFTGDHYAYVIGYPDGKVKPEASITRAEVATVFFRLLEDEVRAQFWTKTNNFTDVNSNSWFNNAISVMSSMGIVSGYPDGSFKPNGSITRAELAKIATEFALRNGVESDGAPQFSDIKGHWAESYIKTAADIGWVNGYDDGTYRPNRAITRAEFMTLVNRMMERVPQKPEDLLGSMVKWPDNANTKAWYYLAVQEATNSHDHDNKNDFVADRDFPYERWTKLWAPRDWAALEKSWSNANS